MTFSPKNLLIYATSCYLGKEELAFRGNDELNVKLLHAFAEKMNSYQAIQRPRVCFLPMAYDGIFNETYTLFRDLQNKVMDMDFCHTGTSDTMKALEQQ